MKMEQLRYLVEISRTKSISQAAANLYLSQPNLSMSIRMLEDELGCTLILRTNRGVQLTAKGKTFVEYAQSIITQFDRLHDIGAPEKRSLECISIANMCFRFVTITASQFFNKHSDPPVRMIVREYSRDGVIQAVEEGHAGIGFINILTPYRQEVLNRIESKGVEFHHISTDAIVAAVGRGSPLYNSDMKSVTREELRAFPMLNYDQMDHYHYADKARLLNISSTKGELITDSRKALQELLENTETFSLITWNPLHYQSFPPEDFRLFPIEDCEIESDFGWICRSDSVLTLMEKEFIDMICDEMKPKTPVQ